jgi:hypothetical protein
MSVVLGRNIHRQRGDGEDEPTAERPAAEQPAAGEAAAA